MSRGSEIIRAHGRPSSARNQDEEEFFIAPEEATSTAASPRPSKSQRLVSFIS